MRKFKDFSLKSKLSTIILFTSSILLVLASTVLATTEILSFRRGLVADLFVLADLVGINNSAALLFDDPATVKENLASLRANPHILVTHLFNAQDTLFASYFKEEIEGHSLSLPTNVTDYYLEYLPIPGQTVVADHYFFRDNYVAVFKTIQFDGKKLATVYLRSDLQELQKRIMLAISMTLIVLLGVLLIGIVLASRLQQVITRPIYHLLNIMEGVTHQNNYSLRAQKTTDDEVGQLMNGFNEMITQIEGYRHHLEEKVQERTVELVKARDQALAANKAKSAFIANVSHEIRTPLNAVLGYAQLLRRDTTLTTSQRDSLLVIEKSGTHLLGLINDILDVSKIEAGAMELRPENFLLNEFIEGLSGMFKLRCDQKSLGWRVENLLSKKQVLVYADQGKLRQILINLLGNAVKFTDQGEVMLRVFRDQEESCFEVTDTGPGISQEALENIFKPFFQDSIGYDKGGTGLGLTISKQQIELMKGTLTVTSEWGHGACFTARLPLQSGESEAGSEGMTQARAIQNYRLHPTCTLLALVADDRKENRSLLAQMLTEIGLEVCEAGTGKHALEAIEDKSYDIVFLKVPLPDMAVQEIIQTLQARKMTTAASKIPHQWPCVAILNTPYESKSVLQLGFHDFIATPFQFEALYRCLGKLLKTEFEVNDATTTQSMSATLNLSFDQLALSTEWCDQLAAAAELSNLTVLEKMILELEQGNPYQQALAKLFAEYLANYDIDPVGETLQKIRAGETVTVVAGVEPPTTEETPATLDLTKLRVSKELHQRLVEATETGNLTVIEAVVAELTQGDTQQQLLAQLIEEQLVDFELDHLIPILEKITYV